MVCLETKATPPSAPPQGAEPISRGHGPTGGWCVQCGAGAGSASRWWAGHAVSEMGSSVQCWRPNLAGPPFASVIKEKDANGQWTDCRNHVAGPNEALWGQRQACRQNGFQERTGPDIPGERGVLSNQSQSKPIRAEREFKTNPSLC